MKSSSLISKHYTKVNKTVLLLLVNRGRGRNARQYTNKIAVTFHGIRCFGVFSRYKILLGVNSIDQTRCSVLGAC